MEHGTKRTNPPYDLISEYEAMNENGTSLYLTERNFHQIIDYYKDEYLIQQAIEAVDHAIGQYPYCVDFLLAKARLLLINDKPYRAMRYLDRADAISPNELETSLLRARAFSEVGDNSEAIELLTSSEKGADTEDKIEIFLCLAAVYENMRLYDEMFDSLVSVVELDPTHPDALERIWVSVELSKKYDESIELHEALLDVDAFSFQAWFNLGHAYACIGEYKKAIKAIEYSFLINDEFELGYLDCAELCCQERMFGKALDVYAELVERFGADSDDLAKIAECHFEMGHIEESRLTLVEALNMDPYNDEVYYLLGKCFLRQDRVHNAVGALIKAIELEDRREEYYAELANAYSIMNEYGKADFYYRKATEVGPEQDHYWVQHCRFLISAGEFEKALHVIEEADYHTFSVELLYCKTLCLIKLDARKKALKVLTEALTDHFDQHAILFELAPELKEDEEIHSILKYYQGEVVNSLH